MKRDGSGPHGRWQVSFAMKMALGALAPLVGAAQASDVNFGPQNCVSLSKTQQGTCMIQTNCDNIDTSQYDFSFVCLTRAGDQETQVKHEFGKGGFDADEDYDTEVACDECLAEPRVVGTPDAIADAHAQLQQYSAAAAPAAQSPPPQAAAFYGPEGCIAAYRSSQGTCVVQTRCTSQAANGLLKEYNYGLTCVDSAGESTRHLFGKNSFDAEETFDTLVECQLCLGFDGAAPGNATSTGLAGDVASLQEAVKGLQADVKEIKESLGIGAKEESKEELKEESTAELKANATEAGETEEKSFLHKFRHHYAEAAPIKHKSRKRREREEDLDEDDADLEADDDADLDSDSDLDY